MDQEECRELGQALDLFLDEALERILFSNPVDRERIARSRLRPLLMKGSLVFQAEEQVGRQAFHRNLSREEALSYIRELLDGSFRQAEIVSGHGTGLILVSRKGKVTVKVKRKAHSGGAEAPPVYSLHPGLCPITARNAISLRRAVPFRSWWTWGS